MTDPRHLELESRRSPRPTLTAHEKARQVQRCLVAMVDGVKRAALEERFPRGVVEEARVRFTTK